jgi:flavodoxin
MKSTVIYYSLDGNTKHVAEKIAKELSADIIPLIPTKEYPTGKVSKYFWGGKSVVFKEKPKLESYPFDGKNYDLILLGTPIWAGTFVPPFRTFFQENKLAGKKVGLFACCSGGSADKCFSQMKQEIPDSTVLTTLRLIDPFDNRKQENNEEIIKFCSKLKKDAKKQQ